MRANGMLRFSAFAALCIVALHGGGVRAGTEIDCLACHNDLIAGMESHTAVSLGCTGCHAAIDATEIPHKILNSVNRGLLADPPRLCYSCHDEKTFTNKHMHPALEMGCGCHSPHASKHRKLLKAPVAELCAGCHDRAAFMKKYQHGPSAAGLCLQCHQPHSSRHAFLLVTDSMRLCGRCHASILQERHLLGGTAGGGHPVGPVKDGAGRRKIKDPFRKGRLFFCVSCHDPHGADDECLVRFPMRTRMDICKNCHLKKY